MYDEHAPSGLKRWLFSTNHKDIGTMYIIFSIIGGVIGGLLSLILRAQLAHIDVLHGNYQLYNVMVTGHALIMVFFMIMPALDRGVWELVCSPANWRTRYGVSAVE